MAFPSVRSSNTSVDSGESHTLNLPASITSGDTIIAFFATDGVETITWPDASWHVIVNQSNSNVTFSVAWRKADETEGASIEVTTGSSEKSSHGSYSIQDAADPTVSAPEAGNATGSDDQPNPPSLSPTGGAKDYMCIACYGADSVSGTGVASSYPSGYNDNQIASDSNASGDAATQAASKEVNASSEDPGLFGVMNNSEQWVAATIAVYPAAGGGGGKALAGTIAAVGSFTGSSLLLERVFSGSFAATSAFSSGPISRARPMVGSFAAVSAFTGRLSRSRIVQGSLSAVSSLTGALTKAVGVGTKLLAGSIAAVSTFVAGPVYRSRTAQGSMAGVSSVVGAISRLRIVQSSFAAVSAVVGSLTKAGAGAAVWNNVIVEGLNTVSGKDKQIIGRMKRRGSDFFSFAAVETDRISARSSSGLKLYDDDGNGILIKDGGAVEIDALTANQLVKTNANKELSSTVGTVQVPVCMDYFDAVPARGSESNWHGGLLALDTGGALNSGAPFVMTTKGVGKIILVVNDGGGDDMVGEITATGTVVDRNTGVHTGGQTSVMTLTGVTTDNSSTDANGNVVHEFVKAYITDKWFYGVVTLTTADVTLTDLDTYHISFEQVNDSPNLVINTLDANIYCSGASAEFDAYLYILRVTGDECNVDAKAEVHVGSIGSSATLANKYFRARQGNIDESLDGTTDGFWVDVHYQGTPIAVEDVTASVWLTKTITVELS